MRTYIRNGSYRVLVYRQSKNAFVLLLKENVLNVANPGSGSKEEKCLRGQSANYPVKITECSMVEYRGLGILCILNINSEYKINI